VKKNEFYQEICYTCVVIMSAIMKIFRQFLYLLILVVAVSCHQRTSDDALLKLVEEELGFAIEQYKRMAVSLEGLDCLPRSADQQTGELLTCGSDWWTSGFFPGSLWYLYEYSGDKDLLDEAVRRTDLLEKEKNNTGTHDLGFVLNNSYGHAYRITGQEQYREVLLTGASSLASRFNEKVGCIRSWDHGQWTFPVIIDNMMNLEYLFRVTNLSGDSSYYRIAVRHANNTLINFFRSDFSSYHLVDFDTLTGGIIGKQTVQGAGDESAWARGQAWGLYGFTMTYRETHDARYLEQARQIASFLIHHPNLPNDGIPYWDFNAPGIPDTYKDASAAAITCSALLELQEYVDSSTAGDYLNMARKIIRSLSSARFRAKSGENGNFILMHSVGSVPHNAEVDVPLSYADYYYIESLLRMRSLLN
jgi:rhamnogalacturonyl hydrolase YesR